MSTHIKTIKGRYEDRGSTTSSLKYNECEMSLTRFYAGHGKGRMLQLTISGDEGYIQLTRTQARRLAEILLESFNNEKYPSE